MTACLCPRCCAYPAKTYTQSWRVETEARLLLTWPLAERQEYLKRPAVQPRRAELEAEIRRQWEAGRGG